MADVPFKATGKRIVIGVARLDGRLLLTTRFERRDRRPQRAAAGSGEQASASTPRRSATSAATPTKIDTRRPVADGPAARRLRRRPRQEPAVITFATPLLCQSRVCGPVVDVVEQVKATAPKDVAFIHQEIYNDNAVNKGYRPQVGAWRLPTEPWTFVVGRDGRIAQRFQGAFSAGELQRAVASVARG